MSGHHQLAGDDVHTPFFRTFADQAARLADVQTDAANVNKLGVQLDTGELFRLASVGPAVWVKAGALGVASVTHTDTDLTAAATTQTIIEDLSSQVPAGAICFAVESTLNTPLAGGTLTGGSFNIQVVTGIGYMDSTSDPLEGLDNLVSAGAGARMAALIADTDAAALGGNADAVEFRYDSVGDNLDQASAFSITHKLFYIDAALIGGL